MNFELVSSTAPPTAEGVGSPNVPMLVKSALVWTLEPQAPPHASVPSTCVDGAPGGAVVVLARPEAARRGVAELGARGDPAPIEVPDTRQRPRPRAPSSNSKARVEFEPPIQVPSISDCESQLGDEALDIVGNPVSGLGVLPAKTCTISETGRVPSSSSQTRNPTNLARASHGDRYRGSMPR
jgi:hypothetical protein